MGYRTNPHRTRFYNLPCQFASKQRVLSPGYVHIPAAHCSDQCTCGASAFMRPSQGGRCSLHRFESPEQELEHACEMKI